MTGSILVVCTGNICRSPVAEGILRAKLTARFGDSAPVVTSAGTAGWEGGSAHPDSVGSAAERGFDISGHVARLLNEEMLEEADLILCMAAEHGAEVAWMYPDGRDRVFTIRELTMMLRDVEPAQPGGAPDSFIDRLEMLADHRDENSLDEFLDLDIADPLGATEEGFRAVAWELDELTDAMIEGLWGPAL